MAYPPVKFEALIKQPLPKNILEEIEKMLTIKAKSDEGDLNSPMPVIHKHIEDEIDKYEKLSKEMEDDRTGDWKMLNQVFLEALEAAIT